MPRYKEIHDKYIKLAMEAKSMRDEILKTAELIKAHENGARIQWRKRGSNDPWEDVPFPNWAITEHEYRVKEFTDTERLDFLERRVIRVSHPDRDLIFRLAPDACKSCVNIREEIDEFMQKNRSNT